MSLFRCHAVHSRRGEAKGIKFLSNAILYTCLYGANIVTLTDTASPFSTLRTVANCWQGNPFWHLLTRRGIPLFKRYISIIIWRIVTYIWRQLMKIALYNLNSDRARNIGVAGLRPHAPAFIGFSSFLLSRGSMAAPTAK